MSATESSEKQAHVLTVGIDLQDTQIRAAVLRGAQICARTSRLPGDQPTPAEFLPHLYATVEQAIEQAQIALQDISAIGVAAPGPLNNRTGILYAPPNLLSWQTVPLKDLLQEHYRLPVFVENDANAAALGEYRFGAGQGCEHMVYLAVSSGIGGGVIANGRLLDGMNGAAAELGHITIDWQGERCACGNIGCLEILASGRAIARQANEAIARGQGAELLAFARTMLEHTTTVPDKGALPSQDFATRPLDPGQEAPSALPREAEVNVTSRTVARAAEAGIPVARAIITRAAEALGVGLVTILHIFSPELVILGGGVTQMGAMFLEPALALVQERTMRANLAGARIVQARLGENAGLIGAGTLPLYDQK